MFYLRWVAREATSNTEAMSGSSRGEKIRERTNGRPRELGGRWPMVRSERRGSEYLRAVPEQRTRTIEIIKHASLHRCSIGCFWILYCSRDEVAACRGSFSATAASSILLNITCSLPSRSWLRKVRTTGDSSDRKVVSSATWNERPGGRHTTGDIERIENIVVGIRVLGACLLNGQDSGREVVQAT